MTSIVNDSNNVIFSAYLTKIFAITIALLIGFWLWLQHHYAYWKQHNVPYIQPNAFFGNFKDILTFKTDPCAFFQNFYNNEKVKNSPIVGLYIINKPCLLIRDLELAKNILIKDFQYFSNRYTASDPHSDTLGAENLFFVKNPKWKQIRTKITPVFTSGKLKQMFPLMEEIGRDFDRFLCSLQIDPKTNSTVQEVKEINALFTTDVIAISAYGIRANCLNDPNCEFRRNGKRIFHFTKLRAFEMNSFFFLPGLARLLKFSVFSAKATQFLKQTISYVITERIKSGVPRNDLIDILVKFKQEAEQETDKINNFTLEGDSLLAQAAVFFSAGFETSSATISFSLYELSRHQDVQKRLRGEILNVLQENNGKITYEALNDMKYLNNVVREVLRCYPPIPFLDRECTLKEGEENYSLKPYSDFAVPHGMPVYIPTHSFHMDPKNFADPETFDPDRFLPEHKDKNNLSAFMPFGTGPHNCIGERFGLVQTKLGLINFLRNHYVTPCEKSHPKMVLDPHAVVIQSKGGIYLNLIRNPLCLDV